MPPSLARTTPRGLPRLLLAAAFLAVLPGLARAWGEPGHRLVAALAEAQLRPAARAEAARLLAGESEPGLAGVANWADDVRDEPRPGLRSTKRWHFVNFGSTDCLYAPARDCPGGDCVVAAIERERAVLADARQPDAARAEALKFLVHLVADVHQPLHATPIPDRGGNEFQVSWHGKGRNLHDVWDSLVLYRAMQRAGVDEAGYLSALRAHDVLHLEPGLRRRPERWAEASCRRVLAAGFYPPSHKLGDDYLDAHRAQVDEQLRLAGANLADMLNFALDPKREPRSP
jgi:hypothetical protein